MSHADPYADLIAAARRFQDTRVPPRLSVAEDPDGSRWEALSDAHERAKHVLFDAAYALPPAPAWTRETPEADGEYWVRGYMHWLGEPQLERVCLYPSQGRRRVKALIGDDPGAPVERLQLEWWPEPITAPPVPEEAPDAR